MCCIIFIVHSQDQTCASIRTVLDNLVHAHILSCKHSQTYPESTTTLQMLFFWIISCMLTFQHDIWLYTQRYKWAAPLSPHPLMQQSQQAEKTSAHFDGSVTFVLLYEITSHWCNPGGKYWSRSVEIIYLALFFALQISILNHFIVII